MEKTNYPSYEELRKEIGDDSEVAESFLTLDFENYIEDFNKENYLEQFEKYAENQYEEITSITKNIKSDYKYNSITNSPFACMEDGELIDSILIICSKENLVEQNKLNDLVNDLFKTVNEGNLPSEDILIFCIKNINVDKLKDIEVGFVNYGLQLSFENFSKLLGGFGIISIAKTESRKFKGGMEKLVPLTNTYIDIMGKLLYGIYLTSDLLNNEKDRLESINNKILETKSYHDYQE